MPGPFPPQTELVIFDCDGVLIDSEMISARALRETLASRGLELGLDYIMVHYTGRSYPSVLADIEARFRVRLPEEFGTQYRQRLSQAFARELKPMPGIIDLLDKIGLPLCVASSSGPDRVAQALALTGLAPYFGNAVFTASQVQNGKPAPDLFLFAAHSMGAAPGNCLVIEDSVAGLQAASAADMMLWWFRGGGHRAWLPQTPPDGVRVARILEHLSEVVQEIQP